jgi:hypothetical protein
LIGTPLPRYATLTSLLRTLWPVTSRLAFISLNLSSEKSCSSFPCFGLFNLVLFAFRNIRCSAFLPFLSVGSAKVRIFSEIPNKINFIFLPFFSSFPLFQYAGVNQLSVLPNRAAKVAIFSSPATFILK